MAANEIGVPEGFVLDREEQSSAVLPDGFVLDPIPAQKIRSNIDASPERRRAAIVISSMAKSPFGRLAMLAMGKSPEEINRAIETIEPMPQNKIEGLTKTVSDIGVSLPALGLATRGVGLIPGVSRLPALTKLATGAGVTAGSEKMLEGKPKEAAPSAIGAAAGTYALGMAGKGIVKAIQATPQAIQTIKNIPDKFFRGGLTKPDAIRIETQYGSSNGTLVETVKTKLGQMLKSADDAYGKVFQKMPNTKTINIRPAIEEAGLRLKRLGLITKSGNLTELGKSEIARDSVYGKLLDFYQSADAISGVGKLAGQPLTQAQMIKASKAMNETMVNKDQYLFLRDKLNALYKGKPSDIDVNKVVNSFYQSGENSGLTGLQAARKLEREAFIKRDRFLNSNTGDLKIATEQKLNRVGTNKPLSRQEMQHIEELQKYVKHPIVSDAEKINKLNKAKETIRNVKKYGGSFVGGIAAGEVGRKIATGSF